MKLSELQKEVIKMLEFQDMFNIMVSPEWKTNRYPFYTAARVELVEAIDHIGFKWWKKQTPNMDQAFIELVDALHFVLSQCMAEIPEDTAEIISRRIIWEFITDTDGDVVLDEVVEKQPTHIVAAIDAMVTEMDSVYPWSDVNRLVQLAAMLGYSLRDLLSAYIQKGVLNIFRQKHGYKDGSYIKVWNGQEDNIHLRLIAEQNPEKSTDTDFLYEELGKIYADIKVFYAD